jgi:hypothetical protein
MVVGRRRHVDTGLAVVTGLAGAALLAASFASAQAQWGDARHALRPWRSATADSESDGPAISVDGRFVAFQSRASNLVGDDANHYSDVFVRDGSSPSSRRLRISFQATRTTPGTYSSVIGARVRRGE